MTVRGARREEKQGDGAHQGKREGEGQGVPDGPYRGVCGPPMRDAEATEGTATRSGLLDSVTARVVLRYQLTPEAQAVKALREARVKGLLVRAVVMPDGDWWRTSMPWDAMAGPRPVRFRGLPIEWGDRVALLIDP